MRTMTTDREKEYGRIEVRDDKVVRTLGGQIRYEIPLTDIKIIGEFTTADGPILDDWFLTIITDDWWYEIPIDAIGMQQLLTDLGQKLGTTLIIQLANSANWKTRIMYPESAKDQELYDLLKVEPKTFWDKVKKSIGLQDTVRQYSSETNRIINKSTMR